MSNASSPDELLKAQSNKAVGLKRWAVRVAIALCLALLWIAITAQSTANA
ncbi:MAG: hypothetical protein ACTS2F_15155 [Thainema sp.]